MAKNCYRLIISLMETIRKHLHLTYSTEAIFKYKRIYIRFNRFNFGTEMYHGQTDLLIYNSQTIFE